jgi:hypothetical protein
MSANDAWLVRRRIGLMGRITSLYVLAMSDPSMALQSIAQAPQAGLLVNRATFFDRDALRQPTYYDRNYYVPRACGFSHAWYPFPTHKPYDYFVAPGACRYYYQRRGLRYRYGR